MIAKLTALVFTFTVQGIASEALAREQIRTPAYWSCPTYSESVLAIFEHKSGYVFYSSSEAKAKDIRALDIGSFELQADVVSGRYAYLKLEDASGWKLNFIENGSVNSYQCTELHDLGKQIVAVTNRDTGDADLKRIKLESDLKSSEDNFKRSEQKFTQLESRAEQLQKRVSEINLMLVKAQQRVSVVETELASALSSLAEANKKIKLHSMVLERVCSEHPELSDFFVPHSVNDFTGEVALCS